MIVSRSENAEYCTLCGCRLHRKGGYAEPTLQGRGHATMHHYVAERFFGRSKNRRGEQREPIWARCPWGEEGKSVVFCYECHEEVLHNPVFLPEDIRMLADLVKQHGLNEDEKPEHRDKLAGRIVLLHDVIHAGLKVLTRASDE